MFLKKYIYIVTYKILKTLGLTKRLTQYTYNIITEFEGGNERHTSCNAHKPIKVNLWMGYIKLYNYIRCGLLNFNTVY